MMALVTDLTIDMFQRQQYISVTVFGLEIARLWLTESRDARCENRKHYAMGLFPSSHRFLYKLGGHISTPSPAWHLLSLISATCAAVLSLIKGDRGNYKGQSDYDIKDSWHASVPSLNKDVRNVRADDYF